MTKKPKLTRLEIAIAVISFVCSFAGNLSSEYLKQMWSTNNDITKTEVVEVRARVLGIIDGSAEPKDSAGCQKVIDALVEYEGIYRSAEARSILETGIDILRKAQFQFKLIEDVTAKLDGHKESPCMNIIDRKTPADEIKAAEAAGCNDATALVRDFLSSVKEIK